MSQQQARGPCLEEENFRSFCGPTLEEGNGWTGKKPSKADLCRITSSTLGKMRDLNGGAVPFSCAGLGSLER